MHRDTNDEIRYGARSKYVTSVRIPHGNRVDRYYMNYNDYGHLDQGHHEAALAYQIRRHGAHSQKQNGSGDDT
jgi:hypothetical protein